MKTEELIALNRKPTNEEVGCIACGVQCDGFTWCVNCGVDQFISGEGGLNFVKKTDPVRYDLLVHYARNITPFKPPVKRP